MMTSRRRFVVGRRAASLLPAVLVVMPGAGFGRVSALVRTVRSGSLPVFDLLGIPAQQRLVLLFQPADCYDRTEPIAQAMRRLEQVSPGTVIGVMFGGHHNSRFVEETAISGGIDFPVLWGVDARATMLFQRLGLLSTPAVILLSPEGEIRFAKSGDVASSDWSTITGILATQSRDR